MNLTRVDNFVLFRAFFSYIVDSGLIRLTEDHLVPDTYSEEEILTIIELVNYQMRSAIQ